MIAAAPIVQEATAEVSDDAGELPDGDVEESAPDAPPPPFPPSWLAFPSWVSLPFFSPANPSGKIWACSCAQG